MQEIVKFKKYEELDEKYKKTLEKRNMVDKYKSKYANKKFKVHQILKNGNIELCEDKDLTNEDKIFMALFHEGEQKEISWGKKFFVKEEFKNKLEECECILRDYIIHTEEVEKYEAFDFNIHVVWQCKTLQNFKAILFVPLFGYLYECTYDGDNDKWYIDEYEKVNKFETEGHK